MRKTTKSPGEKIVKDIKRATRKQYSSEEKIRIVLDGLRGEDSIAELCRREGISQGVYYKWSKDFMEAGKRRLAGDTARTATTDEVKDLRREARDLKEVVAEVTGNPILLGLLDYLAGVRRHAAWQREWEQTYRRLGVTAFTSLHSEQHSEIVASISRGSESAAFAAMRRHLETIFAAMQGAGLPS